MSEWEATLTLSLEIGWEWLGLQGHCIKIGLAFLDKCEKFRLKGDSNPRPFNSTSLAQSHNIQFKPVAPIKLKFLDAACHVIYTGSDFMKK